MKIERGWCSTHFWDHANVNDLVETYFLDRISFSFLLHCSCLDSKLDYPFKSDLRLVKIINLIKLPNPKTIYHLTVPKHNFALCKLSSLKSGNLWREMKLCTLPNSFSLLLQSFQFRISFIWCVSKKKIRPCRQSIKEHLHNQQRVDIRDSLSFSGLISSYVCEMKMSPYISPFVWSVDKLGRNSLD